MRCTLITRLSTISSIARYYIPKRMTSGGEQTPPGTYCYKALTNAHKCVNYEFGKTPKTACIPASIQLRVTKGGARAVLFSGSVVSGSGGVVRDFEDVDGF